tara:strand:- start:1578 stop:1994 length:417 start_codon:yes stop_codon:yes gene_type:complete
MSISITEYRNAKVMNADGSIINVEINTPNDGWVPYTLNTADTDTTIDNSALLTLIGDDKEAFTALTAEQNEAELAEAARMHRNFLLGEMDSILSNPLRWNAMSSDKQAEWTTYRQALLDVPAQSGFPETISWPTKPDV